ncbi:uncharacterized protein Cht6 isoform X2 [Diabrotica undecimpunctata]|uniref:uncharacterized protein Cht6 isoform X2 n=1 Tax=Diabrotica undecimpunctata TaxID=50387 RepID=UPI003B6391F3
MLSAGICRWLFLLVSLATWVSLTSSQEMRVVCYYTNWSIYRPGDAKFSPQNINPYLCTHLIYAFGGFTKENTLKPFDKYQDIEKGGYAKFTGLKTYNKNLKTMLAIGGWNEGSTRFSPMVANATRRKEFARNAIKFLRLNHFDGLDLDWEYPSFRDGGKPRDKANYPLLVQDLSEEFDREAEKTGRPRLLLTMAVPAGVEYINKGFDVPELNKYLDWMNILSYDYHSAFEPAVNHHAPLYSLEEESEYNYESDLNIDHSVKHYLKLGADPSKLVLGIPTYGRSYTLLNPDAFEIGSPADGPGTMGEATRENGYLAYYEVCDYVKNQDWEVDSPNPKVMGPYAFKDNQWVGYDDEEIVKRKAEYVAENRLGGIMFWSIDNDDFRGKCHGKAYPLVEAGRAALLAAYGITDDNLIAPPSKPIKSRTRTRTKSVNKIEAIEDEKTEKPEKIQTRRRNRTRPTKEKQDKQEIQEISTKRKNRRKEVKDTSREETSSYSSLKVVTPSWTTPAPPATPDMDGGFKCEDDGFYPHPKDCKKYYWCLSGAGDSGIVAHQFTCPAGLYFNKAADSCDYTQNVLCNKKMQKVTTTTTTTTTSTTARSQDASSTSSPSSLLFSTRVPSKIGAGSRSIFRHTTTTTEAYEDDDEEYDDDEEEEDKKESEEDPRVIKELIELIKKAGGLEELEKQFKVKGESPSNSNVEVTTKSSISKSLYERVLSKAIKNTPTSNGKNRNTIFRNSRGPQSQKTEDELKEETKPKVERGKLQYTSISRFRPSVAREKKVESVEDDEDIEHNNEDQTSKRSSDKFPTYTNIRRARISTTSEPSSDRNKILGELPEDSDDEESEEDNDDDEDDDDIKSEYTPTTKKANIPHYVNIRRQRPSTTEESSTSQYNEIKRGSTAEATSKEENSPTTSKYKQIRRGTTTATTTTTNTPSKSETQQLSNATENSTETSTASSISDSGFGSSAEAVTENRTTEDIRNDYVSSIITTTGTYVTSTDDINAIKSENNVSKSPNKSTLLTKPHFLNSIQRKRPQLFEPRPFTKPTESTTSRSSTSQATKIPFRNFLRGTNRRSPFTTRSPTTKTPITNTTAAISSPSSTRFSRPTGPTRRKFLTRTTTAAILESQESTSSTSSTTKRPRPNIFDGTSRRPFLRRTTKTTTTTKDPTLGILTRQTTLFENDSVGKPIELRDVVVAIQNLQNAPVPSRTVKPLMEQNLIDTSGYEDLITTEIFITTASPKRKISSNKSTIRNTPTTVASKPTVYSFKKGSRFPPDQVKHTIAYTKPFSAELYPTDHINRIHSSLVQVPQYTDLNRFNKHEAYMDNTDITDQLPEHSKVLLHSNGVIECLDQGNFPHPASCKKFISCAKMDRGKIIGWEYTCPKNLSFDPIGGICNWAADLSCDDK